MVLYFNKKDLVKFGEYLLSDERKKRMQKNLPKDGMDVNIKQVWQSDVENFLESIKKVE